MSERSSTPIDDAPAIRLSGVTRSFGGVRALDGVDCVIPPATLTALVGANGSGKSTLLRIIGGVIAPDGGTIAVFGRTPRSNDASFRAMTGYASQDLALDGEITGLETLRLFHALRGLPHRERDGRLATLVEEFELAAFLERRVGGYSGGQRQRLHLALEAMHAPALLLLDEPTASLDPAGRSALWRRLVAWRERGHTIVIITHDLHDVQAHCDRAIVMHAGRIIADDDPESLIAAHGRARTTIELVEPPRDAADFRAMIERTIVIGRVDVDGAIVTITRGRALDEPEPALEVLRSQQILFTRFERHAPDLASAFFELTGRTVAESPDAAGTSRDDDRGTGRDAGGGGGGGAARGGGAGSGAGRGAGRGGGGGRGGR